MHFFRMISVEQWGFFVVFLGGGGGGLTGR